MIGLVAKADASTGDGHEAIMSALSNIVTAHEAGDIASILRDRTPTGVETGLDQRYDGRLGRLVELIALPANA